MTSRKNLNSRKAGFPAMTEASRDTQARKKGGGKRKERERERDKRDRRRRRRAVADPNGSKTSVVYLGVAKVAGCSRPLRTRSGVPWGRLLSCNSPPNLGK